MTSHRRSHPISRSCLALAALLAAVALPAARAHAAPLLTGFGGPAGFGTNVLPGNDDGSTAALDLTVAFPGGLRFFGGPYNQFWVNNNGNITFSGPVFNFTPTPFPVAARPMIAPYWADVDTRGGGAPARNGVYWHLEPGRLIVTWHNVGYFNTHDDRQMDFQLVITNSLDCGSGDFDVEFRYNTCQWTTGDASSGSGGLGGTPAQAGFDAGNSTDFVEIPGSRTAAILNLCTTTNVPGGTELGIYRFSVRGGEVSCPGTGVACAVPDALGACALGLTQCVGRDVVCAAVGTSGPERCDGIDNDCDGTADNGMGLCSGLNVCVAGVCVPPCFEGGCASGQTCNSAGVCVETACEGVTCEAGQRCVGGTCVDACAGITCPHGQQCVAGRCTALCDVLVCGENQVCVDGACVAQCPCRRCADGEVCGADGACAPVGCDIVTCDPGFYCSAGACLDACEGAVCPTGQRCEAGACTDIPPEPDAGMPMVPDAGIDPGLEDAGGGGEQDAGATDTGDAGRRPSTPRSSGCGCAVPVRDASVPPMGLGLLAALGLVLARRRTR